MSKFSQLLITLPVLALPFVALATKPALAETVGVERALELLAKSTVVDNKCNVLTVSERDELSTYVAKAEVAGAERTTLEVTRSALALGRKAGLSVICGVQASNEVKETLIAAREAINKVAQEEPATPEPAAASQAPASEGSLAVYGKVIEAYLLERRCTYLSKSKMNSFYKAVVRGQIAVVSEFGKTAVSNVMRNAGARANAQGCNGIGEARVQEGFAEIASR